MSTIVEIFEALVFSALLLGGLAVFLAARYQGDLRKARERVRSGSQVLHTPCGEIEYAESGDGQPVLVIHGAGGGFDQGLDIAAPLMGQGFRLIAVSRFGYLRSPLPDDASAEAQADACACLLDALKVERAVVVGASAGGPSAMQFALRHPARTQALVLLAPAAYAPGQGRAPALRLSSGRRRLLERAMGSDFLFWLLVRYAPRFSMRAILATPPESVRRAEPEERAAIYAMLNHVLPVSARRAGLLNDAAVVFSLPRYELERIGVPTLILAVEDDLYGIYAGARYCAEHIPEAHFVSYASGGHLAAGHRREMAAAITAFLAELPRA
ncbi:MAG TPA: alpha/beta hydrolase [Gallionellaceae bacterium]|nr:alpha/beta hydrolase [Gallionellaceae bacterium]